MWENIIITAVAIVLVVFVFCFGYVAGAIFEYPLDKPNEHNLRLHCFQCEYKMPVKEENGDLYCSNCGLVHAND